MHRAHLSDPKAFGLHDIITGDNVRTGSQRHFGPRSLRVAITPRLTAPLIDAQLAAAAAGLGIAKVLS